MTASAWAQLSVTNPQGPITVNDNAQASPFPSTNRIQGAVGVIQKVTVRLNGVTHGYPDDLDILLRGPGGQMAWLWSDAGGQFDLGNADVTIDPASTTPLPNEAVITSGGTYAPANYDGGDADNLAGGLPSGTISAGLNEAFRGLSGDAVNGRWDLYAADDTVVDSGSIRSWVLNVYMSPTLIVSNAPVAMTEDTATDVNVIVDDVDSALSGLTLSATSGNTDIIANSGLTFTGTGTNRVLRITPVANKSGTVEITVTVKDEQDLTFAGVNQKKFTVNIAAVNDAPTMIVATSATSLPVVGITTNITIHVRDIDSDPLGVVLTATSSNPNVIPATNVLFRRIAVPDANGAGTNRVVQIASGATAGTATITIIATDSEGNASASSSQTITVTVNPVSRVVAANPTAIQIPDLSTATAYPSQITIPNSPNLGLVGKVVVSLVNFEAAKVGTFGAMLVSPTGAKVVLMRGNGDNPTGLGDANDVRIAFDVDAAATLPNTPFISGTYKPADLSGLGNFPAPAPAGPYNSDMNTFKGVQANGVWSLYVYDTTGDQLAGAIAGGWTLEIYSAPVIGEIAAQTTVEDKAIAVPFTVADFDGVVTNVVASASTGSISITPDKVGNTAGLSAGSFTYTPAANFNGSATITLTATDNNNFTATRTFTLNITPVNDVPTQSVIPKQITRAGQSTAPVSFTVGDVETPAAALVVSVTSNNPKLLPPGAIILGGSGATRTITIFPAGAQAGSADITVTVTDTGIDGPVASGTQTFQLTVNEAANPLFENISGIEVIDNNKANPYPSIINVSGLQGTVSEIQATLYGIAHPQPEDLDILLVGPGTSPTSVMLMSDAGGAAPLNNVTLRFRQTATEQLPDGTQIVSGDFRPTDFEPGDPFQSPAPGAPTSVTLDAFVGGSPNGDWKLYVIDDSAGPRGGVISSWQLSVRTRPVFTAVADQTTTEDTPLRFTVQLGDNQPGVPYVVTYSKSPAAGSTDVIKEIVTSTGEVIGAGGATVFGGSQTLTINPLPDASGTNSVTLTFTDPSNFQVSRTFNFIVTPVNDAPRFGDIANASIPSAITTTVQFTVSDPEGKAVTVTASSSDQNIVADSGLAVIPATGTQTARAVNIAPSGVSSGQTTITLTATDADNQKSTKTFVLTVTPNVSFINSAPIIINDQALAAPYPSLIDVSGVNGTVSGAVVVLVGFTHPFPDDVDVLLVSPENKAVMLMSDAGGGTPVSGLRLSFAQPGPGLIPIPDESALVSAFYSPANYAQSGEVNEMPSPAPAPPAGGYSTSLSTFAGGNPNGQWRLYVRDDTFPDGGQISGGWILLLQTAPTISAIPTQTVSEDTVLPVRFTVSDQDTTVGGLTVTTSVETSGQIGSNGPGFNNPELNLSLSLVTNSVNFPNVSYTLNILAATNQPSGTTPATNRVTVTVNDGNSAPVSTSFIVVVTPVDDAPQISGVTVDNASFTHATNRVVIAESTTSPAKGNSATIHYTIKDVDSVIGTSTNIVIQSLNPALIPNATANLAISGPNNVSPGTAFDVAVVVRPATNISGTAVLNLIVSDRTQSSTNQITVEVTPVNNLPTVAFPTMSGTPPTTNVIAGASINNIALTVNDVETPASSVLLTAFSSDTTLIPNANIALGGRDVNRTISLTTVGSVNVTTPVTISVVADDTAGGKTTNDFRVNVTPAPGSIFANTTAITIPATGSVGSASPYPSSVTADGLIGIISRVTVTLDGLTHTAPDDIDILLVSPTGKKVVIMSDAGGRNPVTNARIVLDQRGAALPDDGAIVSGTFRPADFEPGVDTFPSPAPAGPYASSLDEFNGTAPNGTWSLFVVDDATGDAGQISFGWSLRIETGPIIALNTGLNAPPVSPTYLQVPEDTQSAIEFTIRDMVTMPADLAVSFSSSNPNLISSISTNWVGVDTTVTPPAARIRATINTITNSFGTNNLTVVVRRSDGAQSTVVVPMDVTPVNDVSEISRLINRETSADQPITIPLQITDVDTAFSRIWVTATSGNQSVVSSTNILIAGKTNVLKGLAANGSSISAFPAGNLDVWTNFITIVPNTAAFSATPVPITIQVQEVDNNGNVIVAQTTSATFALTVNPVNHNPTIIGAGGNPLPAVIAVEAGQSTTNIVFNVADVDNDPLTITATSSDQNLVRDSDIRIFDANNNQINGVATSAGTKTVRVQTVNGAKGDATITLSVRDPGNGRAAASFIVRLTPTRELVFSNRQPITIRDNNSADPYPSQITVSGFSGNVSKVTVTLNGFWHTFPDDADLLLVSPAGQKVIIMSDAGGSTPITSAAALTLRFDDTDANAIPVPDSTALTSRTFSVANYDGTSSDDFLNRTPAGPAGPFATALSAFNGFSPNGVWSLYAIDDTAGDAGAITNGWSIGITTLPVLAGLTDLTSREDVPAAQSFTIAEEAFANPSSFTFAVASTNTAVVPASTNNIVVTGTGTNRTVTVIPTANASGTTLITLTEETTGVSGSFHVTFTPVNDVPTITPVPNQTVGLGSFVVVQNFNYGDVETAKKDLVLTITSSNPTVIPAANVVIVGNDLRIFAGTQAGTSRITIAVRDTDGAEASTSFDVTVGASPNTVVFSSTGAITINDNSKATPYPSTIEVRGVNGTVSTVTVTLTGLTHPYPGDVDILLVGPNGQGVVLMSDAGSGGTPQTSLTNVWLILSDSGSQNIPVNSGIIPFSVYKPTNYEPGNNEFASPAPPGPYSATFTGAFNGIVPNGTWSLYVQDDTPPDAGSLAGWVLNVGLNEVGPELIGLVNTNALEDALVQVPFTVVSATPNDVTFVNSASNPNLVSSIKVSGAGADRVLQIGLVPNANGQSDITVAATDATGTRTRTFTLTVTPVNDAPEIDPVADITITRPTTIPLSVRDIDTPLADLTFIVGTSGAGIVSNVQVTVSSNTVSATITPATNRFGTEAVAITVSDGSGIGRTTFNVTVAQAGPPVLGPIADVTTSVGQSASVPLTVTDPDTALADLTFFASQDGTLAQSIAFPVSGSNVTMVITAAPGQTGTENITVSVSDGTGVSRQSFRFTVTGAGPVISPIANTNTLEDVALTIPITVTPSNSTLAGTSTNPNLVRNVTFITVGGSTTATINLVTNAFGVADVTITATSGGVSSSQTFRLSVEAVCEPPVIGTIAPQTATGSSLTVTIPVTDADDAVSSLSFSAAHSGGASLVTGVTFNTNGPITATFTLVANATGTEQITVQASDGCGVGRQTFSITAGGAQTPATLAFAKSGTNFVITVNGTVGASYVVESSTNLTSWGFVQAVTIGANGSAQVTVPMTGRGTFFRARSGASSLVDVTRPGDPIVLVNGQDDGDGAINTGGTTPLNPPAAESVDHVIDNAGQKYLNFLDLNSGFIVTPSVGSTVVTGLRLWTANDSEPRDPSSYKLEGSTTGTNGTFAVISQGPLALPAARNPGGTNVVLSGTAFQEVFFANIAPYTTYRLTFPTTKGTNAAAANSMQIAEVEFLGK